MRLKAPRGLMDPVACNCASLRVSGFASPVSDGASRMTGVRRMWGAMRAAAARIWSWVGMAPKVTPPGRGGNAMGSFRWWRFSPCPISAMVRA